MKLSAIQDRRGIALVITLIMLSVVTITAVAFLAVSRRERSAVAASSEQIDARYAADAALNRVKAEIASRINISSNRAALNLMVSTNYQNPKAKFGSSFTYVGNNDFDQLTNVNYATVSPDSASYYGMLANLYYDPRPPIFVPTNSNARLPSDFRFYLDVNRNGRFETNGWQVPLDRDNRAIGKTAEYLVGDPEWIGVLENSGLPHSGSNRFGARFAYLVLPAGRAMDVNFVHNSAKDILAKDSTGFFMRHQGVGGWELNLGGFLSDLNTNSWPINGAQAYDYRAAKNIPNRGAAFADASMILQARRRSQKADGSLADSAPGNATAFFQTEVGLSSSTAAPNRFQTTTNAVDWYSDGMKGGIPIRALAEIRNPPLGDDLPSRSWVGGDFTNSFKDITQLFDPAMGIGSKLASQGSVSTYDRYTFHRLLAQLGTDGPDARFESGLDSSQISTANPTGAFYHRSKLNLNFAQIDPAGDRTQNASVAPFRDWTPLGWFTNAAHRLLLTEFTNGLPYLTAAEPIAGFPVQQVLTNSDNTRYLTTAYGAQTHRLLQVAANIYDYGTNRTTRSAYPYVPSVFQPVLYRHNNSSNDKFKVDSVLSRLARFDEVTNAYALFQQPWVDLEDRDFTARFGGGLFNADGKPDLKDPAKDDLLNGDSLRRARYVGLPLVIGAKKGFPNFNEAFWQSALQVTRRLFVSKTKATDMVPGEDLPFGKTGFTTTAQYRFDLTNQFAAEAWNSYGADFYAKGFPRGIQLIATNVMSFGMYRQVGSGSNLVVGSTNFIIRGAKLNIPANTWPGLQFTNALNDLLRFSFVYDHYNNRLYNNTSDTNLGRVSVDLIPPVLHLYVTNRLVFALVDTNNNALLDYVSFKSVLAETNVMRFFGAGRQTPDVAVLRDLPGGAIGMPSVWRTNVVSGGITAGISNQMAASLGKIDVGNLWRDPVGNSLGANDRKFAINGLYYFIHGRFPTGALQISTNDQKRVISQFGALTNVQVGFNPSPTLYLTDRLQANDPLVHYTREDLAPGYTLFCDSGNYSEIPAPGGRLSSEAGGFQLTTNSVVNLTGLSLAAKRARGGVIAYAPWGTNQLLRMKAAAVNDSIATSLYHKDPQITRSDAWAFPTNPRTMFPNIGFLGRVHRGTPWQTLYLKSTPLQADGLTFLDAGFASDRVTTKQSWAAWSGSPATYPTADWKFLDLFTTAINDNAGRGLMSVNQTNIAAWSALLSGVSLLDTSGSVEKVSSVNNPTPFELRPNSPELKKILAGYTNNGVAVPGLLQTLAGTNAAAMVKVPVLQVAAPNVFSPGGSFTTMGSILSVPTLSDRAPFLFDRYREGWSQAGKITDEVVERLPQQILSLVRADEPRVVVYSYGQSLKPALNSLVTKPGYYYGLCTNYQITGEYVTKTTLRFDGAPGNLRAVVEDHRVLYPNN